jgi:hypothetical protein
VTVVERIFNELACTEPLTLEYIKEALRDICTFDRKQHDYGPENIAAFGEKGVVVRMNDKMARLRNLVWGYKLTSNEPIDDSYTDLSVYGVIARMCRAGVWPGVSVPVAPEPPAPANWDRWEDTPPPSVAVGNFEYSYDRYQPPEDTPPEGELIPVQGLGLPARIARDHWGDPPLEPSTPTRYFCPRCQCQQSVEAVDGGFACWNCHTFLFGPGNGSFRHPDREARRYFTPEIQGGPGL